MIQRPNTAIRLRSTLRSRMRLQEARSKTSCSSATSAGSSLSRTPRAEGLSIANPRVEIGVQDVDEEIDEHEDGGDHQDHPLDHGVVTLVDRVEHQLADARP